MIASWARAAAIHGLIALLWAWLACAIVVGIVPQARPKDWPYVLAAVLISVLPARAAWRSAQRARRIATGQEAVPVHGGSPATIVAVGIVVALFLFFLYAMMRMDERRHF